MIRSLFLVVAGVLALALVAPAQIGTPLPRIELKDFTQTQAKSLEDYVGRALLVEFFAYT